MIALHCLLSFDPHRGPELDLREHIQLQLDMAIFSFIIERLRTVARNLQYVIE